MSKLWIAVNAISNSKNMLYIGSIIRVNKNSLFIMLDTDLIESDSDDIWFSPQSKKYLIILDIMACFFISRNNMQAFIF